MIGVFKILHGIYDSEVSGDIGCCNFPKHNQRSFAKTCYITITFQDKKE